MKRIPSQARPHFTTIESRSVHPTGRSALAVSCIAVILASGSSAQVTQRVSESSSGVQSNGQVFGYPAISSDGRCVAFGSIATNLVPGGASGVGDVYLKNLLTNATEQVSVSSGGAPGSNSSQHPSLSANGRYVAFESLAVNLVPGDGNGTGDIFVRDRLSGTTEIVSLSTGGAQTNGYSQYASISADGRYVAFTSYADNLVAGDTNFTSDVFVRDRLNGTTERVSVDSSGAQGNGSSGEQFPTISGDGRFVAFSSLASNLVAGDTNGSTDVFVHDRQTGTTERVSVDSNGVQSNGYSGDSGTAISGDGRSVAFSSDATNLVLGDTNFYTDVFVRDRQTNTTQRVNLGPGGLQANSTSGSVRMSMSTDGRFVVFDSLANNLVSPDSNSTVDVYARDLQLGVTERLSLNSAGVQGNNASYVEAVSGDGRFTVFQSNASNLVTGDTNGVVDAFVRDRNASGSTNFCDPGVGGVTACPCANAPSGLGRGCDNSSSTGGAILSASGIAYLSMDSLVFTTSGEKPTATSILMQGTLLAANGLVFGQGVRCVGGSLKRLYTKAAVGGSITAPNFGAGDPAVSVRSSALGDVLAAGQSRFYLVYYRDPVVLGGCPATSSFNATQTSRVIWGL